MLVATFYLTYVGAVPYDRIPSARFVNWVLPFGWGLFALYTWGTGRTPVERYSIGATLFGAVVVVFGTVLWSLPITRLLIAVLFVLGLSLWLRDRGSRPAASS